MAAKKVEAGRIAWVASLCLLMREPILRPLNSLERQDLPRVCQHLAKQGDLAGIVKLVATYPTFNFPKMAQSLIYDACADNQAEILKYLLKVPTLILSPELCMICASHVDLEDDATCLRLLLNDSRLDVQCDTRYDEDDPVQEFPLIWSAIQEPSSDAVRWLLALRPDEVDLGYEGSNHGFGHRMDCRDLNRHLIWEAEEELDPGSGADGMSEEDLEKMMDGSHNWPSQHKLAESVIIEPLLHNFAQNKVEAVRRLRIALGLMEELFGLVVLLSDGHLSPAPGTGNRIGLRFFAMMERLPMELQTIACRRVFGEGGDLIKSEHLEPALKHLIRLF